MGGRDDELYYEQEAATDALIENAIREISEENVRTYLGCNGDAIDARVQDCMRQARELTAGGYFQAAHVLAVTAIEIIVRYLLVRPLLQGAFLSDERAYFITKRISSGRSAEDRDLLMKILRVRGIEVGTVRLERGNVVWDAVVRDVYPKRNRIIHAGEAASAEEAQTAIECATKLYEEVVLPIANELGFTLERTGRWSVIDSEANSRGWSMRFMVSSPFE